MKKTYKKGIIIFLSILIGCIPVFSVLADELSSKKNQLEDVKSSIESAKKSLEKTKEQKKNIISNIANLEGELAKVDDYLVEINNQIEELEDEIDQKQEQLVLAEKERETEYEAFKERLKYMYMNKKVGYMEVLLHSKDFSDLLNRVDTITKIAEHDKKMMQRMKENEDKIKGQKEELKDKQDEVALVKKHQLGIKHSIEETRHEKENMLIELNNNEATELELIKEQEEASKQLEKEIVELTRKSNRVYSGGQFEWPIPGHYYLSSPYGRRTSPIYGSSEFHTGIDIPAPKGTDVLAAAAGEVITAGYVRGYGYTIIIDHGSGITTLYGHNSKLIVSVGQIVERGQVIAEVGSTGNSTGNHSHFEVRINGKHTNPMQYVSK